MTNSAQLEQIREFVRRTFGQLADDATDSFRETILVHDGQYCGRRFSSDNHHAVWFVEEEELKFYGPDGSLLKVIAAERAVGRMERHAA